MATPDATSKAAPAPKPEPNYTHVTLILDPSIDKWSGPYRFPVPILADPKNKQQEPEVEIDGKIPFLAPGSNLVELKHFEAMQRSPFFERCVRKGVVRVCLPEIVEGGRVTGTSADYAMDVAIDIIEQSSDSDWLQRSIAKDDRDGIAQACQGRVREIEETLSRQNEQ